MKIREIFEAVSNATTRQEKESILKNNSSPLLDSILYGASRSNEYDIKEFDVIEAPEPTLTIDDNYEPFKVLLEELSARTLTTRTAKAAVGIIIGMYIPEDRIWLERILNKNLEIGIEPI